MSVDVKVEKFDVNSGLEASVIIDGDVFTINIDSDSVQKVLAENTVELTQANLEKFSNSSEDSVSSYPNPVYMTKRKQLSIDLTGLSEDTEDNFKRKYHGTVRNTNVDAAGGGEEIVYGYEQATLDDFNGKFFKIKKEMDEISNTFSINGSTKSTTSVDSASSDSEIKKANEDFEKEFGKYKNDASKEFLEKDKVDFVGYHRDIINKLSEMRKSVNDNNTVYGLQFRKNIQHELNVTEEDIESEKSIFLNLDFDSESSNGSSNKSDSSSSNGTNDGSVNIRKIKEEPYIIRIQK
jgi:hypothetical protein